MLKNRKFLFGLGTGIMLGAILVQLSFIGSTASTPDAASTSPAPTASSLFADNPSASPQATLSPEELASAAKRQGKVVLSQEEYAKLKQPAAASSKPAEAKSEKRYLYIYKGMDSDSVEEYLYQAGVIRDRLAFRERLKEKGLTQKIVANLYGFEPDSDINAVIAALTEAK
ncbi:hypothetical protein [Gorillibacterium sp. sgz500922]|uniref:hypothetical protein n=1 Tax=Gorillibacterium sp. sgz500922 TaxID=3446694 RepID=UPI003F664953